MKKALAIYFTGTGNSKRIIDLTSNELQKHDYAVDIVNVSDNHDTDICEYDLLVISYPIYAFNAPKPVIDYVKRFKKVEKPIKCVIVKNSGEHLFWNNASSLKLISILKRKNIIVTNEYHYLMPYSFMFRHSDYMAYRMYHTASMLIPMDINDFFNDKEHHYKRFIFDRPFSFVFSIQRLGGKINGKTYKVNYEKCLKCHKCINECPAGNIKMDGEKIIFGGKCLMCQKCVMNCPTQAIKEGLFRKWQVGRPYSFEEVTTFQKEIKPHFCAKNYKRYFDESEERIRSAR